MKCQTCKTEQPEGAKFCGACSTPLPVMQEQLGTESQNPTLAQSPQSCPSNQLQYPYGRQERYCDYQDPYRIGNQASKPKTGTPSLIFGIIALGLFFIRMYVLGNIYYGGLISTIWLAIFILFGLTGLGLGIASAVIAGLAGSDLKRRNQPTVVTAVAVALGVLAIVGHFFAMLALI